MVSTIRMFGGELGVQKGYVDVNVVGITENGAIILSDGTDTWSMDIERLVDLFDKCLAYNIEDIDTTSETWNAMDKLEDSYKVSGESNKSHYVRAAKELFRGKP